MCYNEKNNSIVPVVELDTIKASDAFGPGSSPGGHTKKTDFIRLFLCVSAFVRSSTEGTPSGCRLTLKVVGSPDARRNTCPKIIPTMRRTRLYAEVSPADTPKRRIYPSFFMRVSRRAKLNRGDPFGVSVDAEGCGFARREEEYLPQNHSDDAAHEALCRSIPSQKTKPVFVIFHFTMSEEKIVCRNCLHNL